MANKLTIGELMQAAGISKSYACEILSGKRRPSAALAVKIYHSTGERFGPIAGLSAAEIASVEQAMGLIRSAA